MVSDIGAVIVTFNRLEKLKKALESYEKQTLLPKYIIVVDNASNDGTKKYLEKWKKEKSEYEKIVVSLSENRGGAGGFYEGQKVAIIKDAAWIMHADDDLYFDKDYFSGINNFIKAQNSDEYSIICGKIIEHEKIAIGPRSVKNKWIMPFHKDINEKQYEKESFYCDMVSYCGVALNKEKLIKAGLARQEYFIWNDDWEHTCRMRKLGKIVCLTNLFANHDTENVEKKLTWKIYYDYRNGIDLMKKHFKIRFFIVTPILIIKSFIFLFLKGRTLEDVKIRLTGIKDGLFGNMGKHSVYCPGWKPKK